VKKIVSRKFDGTCCLVRDGLLFRRFDRKNGKAAPTGWEPAMASPDPVTGHWTGWVAVGDGPNDRWHREAHARAGSLPDGTYELCGPHFQANPEGLLEDVLIPHLGAEIIDDAPRSFEALREFLRDFRHEGIVWHRDPARGTDGDMVKIKRRDFWGQMKVAS
jgi:hypothetical protein